MQGQEPLVSIIIPHFNGREILKNCLESLVRTRYAHKEIIVVDNASTDGSPEEAQRLFPKIQVLKNRKNLGYAGGCNSGLASAKGTYVVFLNNDTEVEPDWLVHLVAACKQDSAIAACQPKLLSLTDHSYFDYAGAAGGLLDIFGYPFARGRIFFTIEKDEGQYDQRADIFWACGTAMLVRKSVLDEVGAFDEDFFAHMEEIDLNWRFHLAGYRVVAVPQAVIYHRAGSTLKTDSPQKIYLNHRNSLIMLLKNYQLKNLLWIFPARKCFELMTLVYALSKWDWARVKAVLCSLVHMSTHLRSILRKRKHTQGLRKVPDSKIFTRLYRGSIVWEYFIRRRRCVQDLHRSALL